MISRASTLLYFRPSFTDLLLRASAQLLFLGAGHYASDRLFTALVPARLAWRSLVARIRLSSRPVHGRLQLLGLPHGVAI